MKGAASRVSYVLLTDSTVYFTQPKCTTKRFQLFIENNLNWYTDDFVIWKH